jgi:hypothetical protein
MTNRQVEERHLFFAMKSNSQVISDMFPTVQFFLLCLFLIEFGRLAHSKFHCHSFSIYQCYMIF